MTEIAKLKQEISEHKRDIRMLEVRLIAVKMMKEEAEDKLKQKLDSVIEFVKDNP
jgi:hypothetical protein